MWWRSRSRGSGNYLRVRGEYSKPPSTLIASIELPPRARRIRTRSACWCPRRGTTSACAENTATARILSGQHRNYLRVRGEYSKPPSTLIASIELPPRARRIHEALAPYACVSGTTSACAENTPPKGLSGTNPWNYLRVRGEYACMRFIASKYRELPPRARRIPLPFGGSSGGKGTTSACAENTPPPRPHPRLGRNYLRVRGEYYTPPSSTKPNSELPPRARRIPAEEITKSL